MYVVFLLSIVCLSRSTIRFVPHCLCRWRIVIEMHVARFSPPTIKEKDGKPRYLTRRRKRGDFALFRLCSESLDHDLYLDRKFTYNPRVCIMKFQRTDNHSKLLYQKMEEPKTKQQCPSTYTFEPKTHLTH